jgi:hypothetical protein
MRKKGNAIFVGIFFIIVIFIFAIAFIFGYKALDDSFDGIYEGLELNESKQVLSDTKDRYPATFDGVMLVLFIGIWIGGLGSALVKEEHPLLFGFMMFIILFVLIAGMFVSNSFEEMMNDSDLVEYQTTFPATYWLLTHTLGVGIGMLLTILFVVMAKNRA